MKVENYAELEFPSRSANEGFARAAAACFAAQLDPTLEEINDIITTGSEERSGMGFTIMESFMDVVKVRSTPGKGTQVTMRKRISPRIGGR